MEKSKRLPRLCCHAPSGQARVLLGGRHIYLGKFGTPQAEENYRRLMVEFVEAGYQPPAPQPATANARTQRLSVGALAAAYAAYTRGVYLKRDKPTTTPAKARLVAELLAAFGAAETPAGDFGPLLLLEFQAWLVARERWVRATVNEYVRTVVTAYRWGVSREMISESAWRSLTAVGGVRKGRPPAPGLPKPREGRKVQGVNPAALEATRAAASPIIRAMIDLQLATGMRPAELVAIRPADLVATSDPGVLAYRVQDDVNKTDHFDVRRVVYIGPRARAILEAHRPAEATAFYFDPGAAERARHARRRAARKVPRYPSHDPAARAARKREKGKSSASWGACYRVDSYRLAIWRACDAAFPHPTLSLLPARKLTPEQRAELAAWRKAHRWSPHQLRHSAATAIARAEKLDVAKLMLGHADLQTTLRYVDPDDERALAAAVRYG
jgi:integrase